MEISRNLFKQPFSTGPGRKTLKNSLRDYFHLLKSPDFRPLVLRCAGSYSRVFNVFYLEQQRLDTLCHFSLAFDVVIIYYVHFYYLSDRKNGKN